MSRCVAKDLGWPLLLSLLLFPGGRPAACLVLSHAATAQHGAGTDEQLSACGLWPCVPPEPLSRTFGSLMGRMGSPTSTGHVGLPLALHSLVMSLSTQHPCGHQGHPACLCASASHPHVRPTLSPLSCTAPASEDGLPPSVSACPTRPSDAHHPLPTSGAAWLPPPPQQPHQPASPRLHHPALSLCPSWS